MANVSLSFDKWGAAAHDAYPHAPRSQTPPVGCLDEAQQRASLPPRPHAQTAAAEGQFSCTPFLEAVLAALEDTQGRRSQEAPAVVGVALVATMGQPAALPSDASAAGSAAGSASASPTPAAPTGWRLLFACCGSDTAQVKSRQQRLTAFKENIARLFAPNPEEPQLLQQKLQQCNISNHAHVARLACNLFSLLREGKLHGIGRGAALQTRLANEKQLEQVLISLLGVDPLSQRVRAHLARWIQSASADQQNLFRTFGTNLQGLDIVRVSHNARLRDEYARAIQMHRADWQRRYNVQSFSQAGSALPGQLYCHIDQDVKKLELSEHMPDGDPFTGMQGFYWLPPSRRNGSVYQSNKLGNCAGMKLAMAVYSMRVHDPAVRVAAFGEAVYQPLRSQGISVRFVDTKRNCLFAATRDGSGAQPVQHTVDLIPSCVTCNQQIVDMFDHTLPLTYPPPCTPVAFSPTFPQPKPAAASTNAQPNDMPSQATPVFSPADSSRLSSPKEQDAMPLSPTQSASAAVSAAGTRSIVQLPSFNPDESSTTLAATAL